MTTKLYERNINLLERKVLDQNLNLLWRKKPESFHKSFVRSLNFCYSDIKVIRERNLESIVRDTFYILNYVDIYAMQTPFNYIRVRKLGVYVYLLARSIKRYYSCMDYIRYLMKQKSLYQTESTKQFHLTRIEKKVEQKVQILNSIFEYSKQVEICIRPLRSKIYEDANCA